MVLWSVVVVDDQLPAQLVGHRSLAWKHCLEVATAYLTASTFVAAGTDAPSEIVELGEGSPRQQPEQQRLQQERTQQAARVMRRVKLLGLTGSKSPLQLD